MRVGCKAERFVRERYLYGGRVWRVGFIEGTV